MPSADKTMRMSRMSIASLCASVFVVSLTACSETVLIRSTPPDADVVIDGQLRGKTPMLYTVPRDQLKEHRVQLKKKGYEPVEDTIRLRVARGRLVGAVFTLGLVYAFRSPYYLVAAERGYVLSRDPAAVAAAQQAERDRAVGWEMRKLNELYQRGEISAAERDARAWQLLEAPRTSAPLP
jgi:hypothetical protein